jgi:exodeoxyribonuclease VII small subunit
MSKQTPARPSYEQARDELTEVVRRLEAGGATLEESLALWERGEALAAVCQELLDGAKARLDAARLGLAPGSGSGPVDEDDGADDSADGPDEDPDDQD